MNENFISTTSTQDIIEGLRTWVDIFKFLGITYIVEDDDSNTYIKQMQKFEADVKKFYDVGSRSFLSTVSSSRDGNAETFYSHSLRYYMPVIARKTYQTHQLGVGIFNMQGFERRNKESKNCMRRFSNNKGNVVVNNMKRLWDVFEYESNAV